MSQELYQKILPALKTKISNLKEFGYEYITEEDVLKYLIENVWEEDKEMAIDEIIADILNTPNYLIKDYLIEQSLKKKNKNKKTDIDSLL